MVFAGCLCINVCVLALPRNTMAKSSLSTHTVVFCHWCAMPMSGTQRRFGCIFFSLHNIFTGNLFQRKGVNVFLCVRQRAMRVYTEEREKKNGQVNLLNVHSDSFEWRDVEILSPSVRDRALFSSSLYFFVSLIYVAFAETKEPYHRRRSIVVFAFDAFVNNI